jgi:GxxExxY protein
MAEKVRLIGRMDPSGTVELCLISFVLIPMEATRPEKSDHPKRTKGSGEGFWEQKAAKVEPQSSRVQRTQKSGLRFLRYLLFNLRTEGNEGSEGGAPIQPRSEMQKSDFVFFVIFCLTLSVHPLYEKADRLSREAIGAAIEVHKHMGAGLIESIYERCLLRELELRSIPCVAQKVVRVEYKGAAFDEPLRFDLLVGECLLLELKAVEVLHPFSKAQLFSYMKLLDVPLGLLINFHEPVLKNGISRMILPGANRMEGEEASF